MKKQLLLLCAHSGLYRRSPRLTLSRASAWAFRSACLMDRCRNAAIGSTARRTDGAGIRRMCRRVGGPTATAIGCGPMTVGTGSATSRGRGRVTTTDAGFMIRTMAGFGCPTRFGNRPGWLGAAAAIMWVGRRCRLNADSARAGSLSSAKMPSGRRRLYL